MRRAFIFQHRSCSWIRSTHTRTNIKYIQQLGANTAIWESGWVTTSVSFCSFHYGVMYRCKMHWPHSCMMRESSKHFLADNSTVTLLVRHFLLLASKTMPLSGRIVEGFVALCSAVFLCNTFWLRFISADNEQKFWRRGIRDFLLELIEFILTQCQTPMWQIL